MVRQIDGTPKAGLHRTSWDLRETAPAPPPQEQGRGARGSGEDPPAGRGGRAGMRRQGPLVKPGTYTVTLGKIVNGAVSPLGQPQKVEVTPLEKHF